MLKNYKPKTEKELHSIIEEHLTELNLELIKHEFNYESNIPDFLCVDNNGSLVIIEVKLGKGKHIIEQAVRYYEMVEKYKIIIAKLNPNIKPGETTKIILISEDYTADTKNIIKFLDLDIIPYTYLTFMDEETGKFGINFKEVVILPPAHPVEEPKIKTLEDHRNYFSDDNLRAVYDTVSAQIKNFKIGIEDYATGNYVGFRLKGKMQAHIVPRRTFFLLVAGIYDEEGKWIENKSVKIETGEEEGISEIFQLIKSTIKRSEKE